MRDTAPYQLVSRLEDSGAALQTEDTPALTDAETAASDQVFVLPASQSETLSAIESSRVVGKMDDSFVQEAAQAQLLVSQEDTDPLRYRQSSNSAANAEHILNMPPSNNANSTPQNLAGAYAGAGQGPGGVSTPNPSGALPAAAAAAPICTCPAQRR